MGWERHNALFLRSPNSQFGSPAEASQPLPYGSTRTQKWPHSAQLDPTRRQRPCSALQCSWQYSRKCRQMLRHHSYCRDNTQQSGSTYSFPLSCSEGHEGQGNMQRPEANWPLLVVGHYATVSEKKCTKANHASQSGVTTPLCNSKGIKQQTDVVLTEV